MIVPGTGMADETKKPKKVNKNYLLLFCLRDDLLYDVDLQKNKKKVINSRALTSNPENKSVHFFQAVLPRIRQHCLLLCGRKLGSQIHK